MIIAVDDSQDAKCVNQEEGLLVRQLEMFFVLQRIEVDVVEALVYSDGRRDDLFLFKDRMD